MSFNCTALHRIVLYWNDLESVVLYCRQQKRRLSRGMAKAYGNNSMASVIESAAFSRQSSFAMMQDSEGQHVYTLASTFTQTKNIIPRTPDFTFFSCSYHYLSTFLSSLYWYSATYYFYLSTILFMLNNETSPPLPSLLFSFPLFSSPTHHFLLSSCLLLTSSPSHLLSTILLITSTSTPWIFWFFYSYLLSLFNFSLLHLIVFCLFLTLIEPRCGTPIGFMDRIKTIESFSQDYEREMALAADLRDPFLAGSHDDGSIQSIDALLSRCVMWCGVLTCVVLHRTLLSHVKLYICITVLLVQPRLCSHNEVILIFYGPLLSSLPSPTALSVTPQTTHYTL